MEKTYLNPNTGENFTGTFHKVRSVHDLLDPQSANVELQFITKEGAVSVWLQYDYKETWSDPEILAFAENEIKKFEVNG